MLCYEDGYRKGTCLMARLRVLTRRNILWRTVVIMVMTSSMSVSARAVDFFVSGHGRDTWSGELAYPGENDGPFTTLGRAQQAVRETRKTHPEAAVRVTLRGGTYYLDSHLASALGFAGCMQGRKVRFFTAKALVTQLMEMAEQRQLERTFKQLERQDILILDELGYVPFSRTAAELLFEVISRAYERLSLIVTTNLPFESWVDIFGCERLTGALLDRLTHRVHIIEANGPSYRLRQSKRRLQKGDTKSDGNASPESPKTGSGNA
ncbi:MAG: ATP-binding protein [Phycisphaerales bacterium]|nr:MAG: ATP-binding protein [Phycisphaerales bacterium]